MTEQKYSDEITNELVSKRESERKRQGKEVAIENQWWGSKLIRDESEAVEKGDLVIVADNSNNYCLIGDLRRGKEPKTVSPEAYSLLNKIGALWKEKVSLDVPGSDEVRLAVTSLFRTVEWQADRIQHGLNAAETSPHQSGMAIDFDPTGYYFGKDMQKVNPSTGGVNSKYLDCLKEVLLGLQEKGDCHVIWEMGYKVEDDSVVEYDNCWHVCVSPSFGKS